MAVMLSSSPRVVPLNYDPAFKVDVRLHDPLWEGAVTKSRVAIDVMVLCTRLEPLCQKELQESSKASESVRRKRKYSNTFDAQAMVIMNKMMECVQNLPNPAPSLQDFLEETALCVLFPRVASYVMSPHNFIFQSQQKTPMDDYFNHVATLNQSVALCNLLNTDVYNLHNHKYIAHQIALLYQSLNQMGNQKVLIDFKTNIETSFKKVKAGLDKKNPEDPPVLPDEQKQWYV
ncbi:uncharacterized protein LOC102805477 [Saccoglossus kowalevskii]|uniref:Uncharacterized protein LOC102805477 n=1 Tax=Saccoglossus kowalevskii TaxID=10224 RepID=A0ABM0MHL6_SACKO|nr:PREDICTED: uncharacterized protein LOC102805477 [Saccoglossus kowalevskii]